MEHTESVTENVIFLKNEKNIKAHTAVYQIQPQEPWSKPAAFVFLSFFFFFFANGAALGKDTCILTYLRST